MVILITLVQLVDIIIHVTLNQIEPIRLVANAVVLIALLPTRLLPSAKGTWFLGLSGGAYLVLNGIFVLQNGLTNPAGGEPRVVLVVIVLATALSGVLYGRSLRRMESKNQRSNI